MLPRHLTVPGRVIRLIHQVVRPLCECTIVAVHAPSCPHNPLKQASTRLDEWFGKEGVASCVGSCIENTERVVFDPGVAARNTQCNARKRRWHRCMSAQPSMRTEPCCVLRESPQMGRTIVSYLPAKRTQSGVGENTPFLPLHEADMAPYRREDQHFINFIKKMLLQLFRDLKSEIA